MAQHSLTKLKFYFQVICAIGFFISIYSLYVETKVEKDKSYKAYCDVAETISCTKAFASKWAKGFGVVGKYVGEDSSLNQPNSIYGILFYLLMGGMGFIDKRNVVKIQIILGLVSNFLSIYLGHILYTELQDLCIVCVALYLLNAILLAMSSIKWNLLACSNCSVAMEKSEEEAKAKSE